jgi:hypothetical protein
MDLHVQEITGFNITHHRTQTRDITVPYFKTSLPKVHCNTTHPLISVLEIREYSRRDPSRSPRGTLYPQKLALTSPTSGGRSVGIVRSRTLATEEEVHPSSCWFTWFSICLTSLFLLYGIVLRHKDCSFAFFWGGGGEWFLYSVEWLMILNGVLGRIKQTRTMPMKCLKFSAAEFCDFLL